MIAWQKERGKTNMSYNGNGIEAVRFGARLGRIGIGCCGLDLIQGFSHSPEDETTFPLRYGDEDTPIFQDTCDGDGGVMAITGTNIEVLKALLTLGTHDQEPKEARSFLVTLNNDQICSEEGRKWLAILKGLGFEYLRSFENGVYGADSWVYLFGYFRAYEGGASITRSVPGWDELPAGVPTFVPDDFYKHLTTVSES